MRLTRTRLRASSRTTSQVRSRPRAHQACGAAGGLVASCVAVLLRLLGVWPTAYSVGRSSTSRTRSSSRESSAGVSVMAAALMRSMSRLTARCSGASRGWAARDIRWSAVLRALSSGSALPVRLACCCARRRDDSMSTTRFSSRERDRLCIRSSSCERCRATSLRRVSFTVRRAAVSRDSSWASRATVRASMAWVLVSVFCRASCCWMWSSFCHSRPPATRAATAISATA